MGPSILYLSAGVFDKGGVSRYGRYQIQALRAIYGDEGVRVLSLLPPDGHGFEAPFRVDFASFGPNPLGKLLFGAATAASVWVDRPRLVFAGHLHLAPLGLALARATGARLAVDIYGAEVWTNLTRARRVALRRADLVLSDCHATADHVAREGLRERDAISIHWDCVDLDRFRPMDPGDVLARYGIPPAAPNEVTLMTLCRLAAHERHKGVDRAIEVMARLRDVPVRFVVVGGGTWRTELEEMARSLGVSDRVFFTGRVSEDDLLPVYNACDIFTLVTLKGPGMGEGLPLTPIEAAACGKPLLVGNQDGSVETVVDGVSGFVLDPLDLDAHAAAIRRLVGDASLRRAMGDAGRRRCEDCFSYEHFARRLEATLRLVQNRR
jgi:phosphatidyl-myo-inositol dimannoside synthase